MLIENFGQKKGGGGEEGCLFKGERLIKGVAYMYDIFFFSEMYR